MMIARLDLAAIDELKHSLSRFAYGPLAHLHHLRRDQVEAYWLDEITGDLQDGSSVAFVMRNGAVIEGLVSYIDSPWDTRVVGRRVGILKYFMTVDDLQDSDMLDDLIAEVVRHAADRGIECLTCKIQPLQFAAIHAIEKHGFRLMDTLLDFVFAFPRAPREDLAFPKRAAGLTTRLAKSQDLAEVLALSEEAFANFLGRYNSDPQMPNEAGAEVYREWVRSSFRGWADFILVAEIEGKIVGYGIWKKASPLESRHSIDIGHYSLAGIQPSYSGRGIYTALAIDGMQMAQSFARYLDGSVHVSNYPVHRALHKLSWKTAGVRHSFHKWLHRVSVQ
jgi:RimJ/RimL family protein N-acetyltransferase